VRAAGWCVDQAHGRIRRSGTSIRAPFSAQADCAKGLSNSFLQQECGSHNDAVHWLSGRRDHTGEALVIGKLRHLIKRVEEPRATALTAMLQCGQVTRLFCQRKFAQQALKPRDQ
jgi:hypothetical protein